MQLVYFQNYLSFIPFKFEIIFILDPLSLTFFILVPYVWVFFKNDS